MLQMTNGLHPHPPQIACLTAEFIAGTVQTDLLTPVLHRILCFQGRYPITQKAGPADMDHRDRKLQVTAHGAERIILTGEIDLLPPEHLQQIFCGDVPRLAPARLTVTK